ncbi:unnamed protein product [Polarella glacialis]|uniref:RanBP2-type domain-containing protein n=1 Tax=Polarella glacialis TaxID=89957 RepID=A0A813HKQ6_POLGL|nr:unnamed protein product [Polarella glacialis]
MDGYGIPGMMGYGMPGMMGGCGMPGMMGGMPGMDMMGMMGGCGGYGAAKTPTGSQNKASPYSGASPASGGSNWTCPSCNNDNYPMRTSCNRCKLPKMDGGMGGGMGVAWACKPWAQRQQLLVVSVLARYDAR